MSIPKCPFNLQGDVLCIEFVEEKSIVALPSGTDLENKSGKFILTGKGPGLPDKESEMDKFELGDEILFQPQNSYMFTNSQRLPNRHFAMLRVGQVLGSWKKDIESMTPSESIVSLN